MDKHGAHVITSRKSYTWTVPKGPSDVNTRQTKQHFLCLQQTHLLCLCFVFASLLLGMCTTAWPYSTCTTEFCFVPYLLAFPIDDHNNDVSSNQEDAMHQSMPKPTIASLEFHANPWSEGFVTFSHLCPTCMKRPRTSKRWRGIKCVQTMIWKLSFALRYTLPRTWNMVCAHQNDSEQRNIDEDHTRSPPV